MIEYWTVEEAAAHWHVSRSRARTLIAKAKLQKRVVYSADEVRAVPRLKQGTRTDLRKTDTEEPS